MNGQFWQTKKYLHIGTQLITKMLTIKAEGTLVGKRTTTVSQVLQRDTARLQAVERTVTHK